MALTTHPHLAPRLKKEQSHVSILPLCLHSLFEACVVPTGRQDYMLQSNEEAVIETHLVPSVSLSAHLDKGIVSVRPQGDKLERRKGVVPLVTGNEEHVLCKSGSRSAELSSPCNWTGSPDISIFIYLGTRI